MMHASTVAKMAFDCMRWRSIVLIVQKHATIDLVSLAPCVVEELAPCVAEEHALPELSSP